MSEASISGGGSESGGSGGIGFKEGADSRLRSLKKVQALCKHGNPKINVTHAL